MRHFARHSAVLCALLFATTIKGAAETDAVETKAAEQEDCRIGSYRLQDGSLVDIGPGEEDGLRWRRFDVTTGALRRDANGQWRSTYGWTDRTDGKTVSFSECSAGEIDFDGVRGHRIVFDVTKRRPRRRAAASGR